MFCGYVLRVLKRLRSVVETTFGLLQINAVSGTLGRQLRWDETLRVQIHDEMLDFKGQLRDNRVVSLPCGDTMRRRQRLTNGINVLGVCAGDFTHKVSHAGKLIMPQLFSNKKF